MGSRCEHCPARPGITCAGESHPAICARAADPAEAGFRSRLGRRATRATRAAFPPLTEQATNLAGAVGRFVASGLERAGPEERSRRAAICRSNACGQFVAGRCARCGCRLEVKQAMASEHCPLDPPLW